MTRAYCEAAVEVLDILNHTSEYKENVFSRFLIFLKNIFIKKEL